MNLIANRYLRPRGTGARRRGQLHLLPGGRRPPARHLHGAHPGLHRHVRGDDRALSLRQVRHGRELVPHRLRHAQSYTLLGGQVLRLPFIPYTSFGHEIAHNWWGNSVFVDTDEGNWCEGLTVYCADYHYKELESRRGRPRVPPQPAEGLCGLREGSGPGFPPVRIHEPPQRGHPGRGLRQEHDGLPHGRPGRSAGRTSWPGCARWRPSISSPRRPGAISWRPSPRPAAGT